MKLETALRKTIDPCVGYFDEDDQGVTPRSVHRALGVWGRVVRDGGNEAPDGWGWASRSVMERVLRSPGRGTSVGLTPPEAAYDQLTKKRQELILIGTLVHDLPMSQWRILDLRYVHRVTNRDDIGLQIGLTGDQVRRRLELVRRWIARQVRTIRPDWHNRNELRCGEER